ncbi:DUF4184 family protein [Roseateles sp. DC23W]|uniref:DUF4184 family protein n=1 Tax=Pelomonas dachongensis TaxID=3299029 RepID=A0ABW7EIB3_9BURK
MPWTFAHPAAILPLRSLCPRWLSLPALILGAMAPDMSYYVGMHGPWSAFCHTPWGIVTACLPVCLLLLALLLRFARPLTVLLPQPHRSLVRAQLLPSPHPLWLAAAVAVLSILLGAATHVLWDSFTHQGRWGAELLPELDETLLDAAGRSFHVTHLLQHLSTAVGVGLLAIAYWRALRDQPTAAPRAQDTRRTRLLLACLAGAVIVGAASAWALTPATLPAYVSHRVVRTVVWSTSCFAALYVLACLVWWRRLGDA